MVIPVPKTPRRAFNKERPPSELLLKQIDHLEWAVRPASMRKPGQLRRKKFKTEGEAAEHIAYLTRMLLESQSLTEPTPAAPAYAPAARKAQKPKTRKTRKTRTSSRKRRRRAS